MLYVEFFSQFIYLFNHLFKSLWVHGYLFHYLVIIFFSQIILSLAIVGLFQIISCGLLKHPIHFFVVCFCTFLLYGPTRCSRLILHFACPRLWIRNFLKGPGSFCNQEGDAHCSWDVSFQALTRKIRIRVCISVINIFISIIK